MNNYYFSIKGGLKMIDTQLTKELQNKIIRIGELLTELKSSKTYDEKKTFASEINGVSLFVQDLEKKQGMSGFLNDLGLIRSNLDQASLKLEEGEHQLPAAINFLGGANTQLKAFFYKFTGAEVGDIGFIDD
jgi:hypothetical protein